MNREALDHFREQLKAPEGGLEKWLATYEDGAVKPKKAVFGKLGGAAQFDAPRLLALNHSLLLYRFYLDCRANLLNALADNLLPQFVTEVRATYAAAATERWSEFNRIWRLTIEFARQGTEPLDAELVQWTNEIGVLEQLFNSVPQFLESEYWMPRSYLEDLLPRTGGAACLGEFFARTFQGKPLRLATWEPQEFVPGDSQQLAVLLVRANLLPPAGKDEKRRPLAPRLKAYTQPQILNILKAVGLIDPAVSLDQVRFAAPGQDYLVAPLPRVDGKVERAEGEVLWNPVPFNVYKGPFELPGQTGAAEPPWLAPLRKFLTELICDLTDRVARQWRTRYLDEWQRGTDELGLIDSLRDVGKKEQVFWRWLNEHSHRLQGEAPLQGKLKALREALDDLRREGLL